MIAKPSPTTRRTTTSLRDLVGSGDRIGLFVLPFLAAGVAMNVIFPSMFRVGGPPLPLLAISIAALAAGFVIWAWAVALILLRVPRGELITTGPYAMMKHPIYTGFALLVLPWIGLLCNTWLGIAIGIVLYIGSRRFAPAEEEELSTTFGASWERYREAVKLPWL